MLDAIGRFFGSPAPTTEPEAKAATGPGVFAMSVYPQLDSISQHPAKLMAEAQVLFHTNPWVAAAERAIYGRYVKAAWHLEDSAGNTIDAKSTGPAKVAYDLLTIPSDKKSRRALWSLTLRHMGLCGNAFWMLDQREMTFGTPLQTLYINPARMTPAESESGELLGWVMDHPRNPVSQAKGLRNPVPFELDEVRHFMLDEPDWGHYGIGIAEAAYDQIRLDELANHHVAGVLASGGRLAGIIAPKPQVTVGSDQWDALLRDWRNITNDPEAAKRLLVVRGPVDFTDTSASLSDLQMVDLMKLGREDVLASWGVPLSQIGVMQTSGLNSGEHVKYEEAALWQGPIDFRAAPFEEQVQSLLDLFGLGLKLVVETPAFDDQAPLFVNAEKASKQPLTNNERRALLGFDPLEDEEMGKAIFIEKSMIPLDLEPPAPPAPFGAPPPSEEDEMPEESGLGEAAKADLRSRLANPAEGKIREAITGFLARQATAVANRIKHNHAHIVNKPSDADFWWTERQWDRELSAVLEPLLTDLATRVARNTAKPFRAPAKADSFLERVIALVRKGAGLRITGINATTRDSVARLVEAGIAQGLSPADLAQQIQEGATFNEARAEMIARTETGTVYNHAAVETYRSFDVAQVEVIDGDHDDVCADANGATWSLDEAMSNPLGHPNCIRDFVPVVATKAHLVGDEESEVKPSELAAILAAFGKAHTQSPVSVHLPSSLQLDVPAPQVTVNVPEQKAPVVTVQVPEQPVPQVTFTPEPAAKATLALPQEVRVVSMPDRAHKLVRNKKGQPDGSVETDAS